jgi:alpha-galactosidase
MTTRITELNEPQRGWRYHSGTTVYTERLIDGRLVAAFLQDTGVPFYANDEIKELPAFDLLIGAELFMVDAGWYADANTPWPDTSGDWQAGNRLPNDLFPVFDYARSKGLRCGLWVEIESAGKASKLATEHPDWFITRYGKPVERVLDLAKPAVREYVESTILRLIERYRLDMFRLDYNLDAWEGGFNLRDGRQENTLWRHVEAMYAI